MDRNELKLALQLKLVDAYPALAIVDWQAVDALELLSNGGEITLYAGACPAGDASIVAVIGRGNADFRRVATACNLQARVGGKSRAISSADAIKFGSQLVKAF